MTCVSTGVKHLHHKALEYEVGVYFEANGHGTVLFSNGAKEKLKCTIDDYGLPEARRTAAERLFTLIDLVNETIGDAIADMLLVETILHAKGWSIKDWQSMYTDLPNKLVKVTVQVSIIFYMNIINNLITFW